MNQLLTIKKMSLQELFDSTWFELYWIKNNFNLEDILAQLQNRLTSECELKTKCSQICSHASFTYLKF